MQNANQSGSALKPSLPSAHGSLGGYGGQFKVSGFTGAGEVSFGGLHYNISAGNGEYGFGFGAASGGGISRSTHRHTPTFEDELDSFELEGSLLVPLLDTSGARVTKYGNLAQETYTLADGTTTQTWVTPQLSDNEGSNPYLVRQYRPRNEGSYALIYYWQYRDMDNLPTNTPSSFWQVIASDNSVSYFGVSNSAKVGDRDDSGAIQPHLVCTWLAEEHLDAMGHCQLTKYLQEDATEVDTTTHPEINHVHHNKIYLDRICTGHVTPLPASLSLTLNSSLDTSSGYEPDWFFETVWDYGQYDILDLDNQAIYTPTGTWTKRLDSHSTFVGGFEIRCHRLCRNVLEFHRFPEEDAFQISGGDTTPLLHSVTSYFYDESEVRTLLRASHQVGYYWNGSSYDTKYTTPVEMTYAEFDPKPNDTERPYRSIQVQLNDDDISGPKMTALGITQDFFPVDLYGEGIEGFLASDGQDAYYYQLDWNSIWDTDADTTKLGSEEPILYQRASNPVRLPFGKLSQGGGQLMDINGNGQLDYVTNYAGQLGYFEAQKNEHDDTTGAVVEAWGSFTPIPLTPTELSHPHRFFADLTGNKIADCVLPMKLNGQAKVRYYQNNGPEGFEPAQEVLSTAFEADVTSFHASEKIFIGFLDIAGDGKQHLVRMDETSLVYYPNYGYGQFGEPISLDVSHVFAKQEFRLNRIHFADLDGSGTTDLIVAGLNGIEIYANQCGNQLATTPVIIAYPEGESYNDYTNSLLFTDVFGNGLTCMIFRKMGPGSQQWVYDFNGGMKPYLMTQHLNNMGATTETTYRSSVHFYLEDKANGIEWFTRAPFPNWSVETVKVTDAINNSVISEAYRYRHSYYDGEEKTFRGYGYAEHVDTVESSDNATLDSPPSKSCVWYHNGNPDQDTINTWYETLEYFMAGEQSSANTAKDTQAQYLTIYNVDWNNVVDEETDELKRQAQLHLAGSVIRSELYGKTSNDSTTWELYSASMSSETVKLIQDVANEDNTTVPLLNYASFQVLPRENLGYHYECQLDDPVVGYQAALAFDNYGHVLQSCALQYPRRSNYTDANAEVATEQQTLRCALSLQVVQNFTDPANDLGSDYTNEQFYLLGVPLKGMHYYVRNPYAIGALDGETSTNNVFTAYNGSIFSYETLQSVLNTTTTNSESPTFDASLEVDLLEVSEQEYYYVQPNEVTATLSGYLEALSGLNRPGKRGFLLPKGSTGAMYEKEGLESALVDNQPFFTSTELTTLMETTGHYQTLSHTAQIGGTDVTTEFWGSHPGTYSYGAAVQFYMLQSYTDPTGSTSTTTYDRYNLLVVANNDALGNTSSITELTTTYSDGTAKRSIDYQLMQPFRMLDINQNSSEVLFDALGRVVATSHYGSYMQWDDANNAYAETQEGFGKLYTEGTATSTFTVNTPNFQNGIQDIIDEPTQYLSNAQAFTHYEPFAWMGNFSTIDVVKEEGIGDGQTTDEINNWLLQLEQKGLINGEGALFSPTRAIAAAIIADTTLTNDIARGQALFNVLESNWDIDDNGLASEDTSEIWIHFKIAYEQSQIPVHVLTTSSKDYPETSNARVTQAQLLALSETQDNVNTWFSTAYAAGYLVEEREANNGQSTYGLFTANMRTAIEASSTASEFADALGQHSTLLQGAFEAFTDQESIFNLYQQALGERIEQHLQYSDGLGRSIQSKIKAEAGTDYYNYNATSENYEVNPSDASAFPRWLTQGHTVYNNKGQVVLAYDPYYTDTADFVTQNDFKLLGTSPINYYDGLNRVTHSITRKGHMIAHAWTAWDETIWDTNDCLWLSPYFQVNYQYFDGTTNPVAVPDLDTYYFDYSDEKLDTSQSNYHATVAQSIIDTIQKSLKQGFTPQTTVHDNRGLHKRASQKSGYQFTASQMVSDLAGAGITITKTEAQAYYDTLKTGGYLTERTLGDALLADQEVTLKGGIKVPLTLGDQTETLVLSEGTFFAITLGEVTLNDDTTYTPTATSTVSISTYADSSTGQTETLFLLWETGQKLPKQLKTGKAVVHESGDSITLNANTEIVLNATTTINNGSKTLVLNDTVSFDLAPDTDILYANGTTFVIPEDSTIARVIYANEDFLISGIVSEVGFYVIYTEGALTHYGSLSEGDTVIHESGTSITLALDTSVELIYDSLRTPLTLQAGQTITLIDNTQVTLPNTTLITPIGDQFLATSYEVWGEMTVQYATQVMASFQSLNQTLDTQYALQMPVVLAVIWQAHINALTPTQDSLKTNIQAILDQNLWYDTDYAILLETLQTGGWLNGSSPVTYPTLDSDSITNAHLNLALMLGWAKGDSFVTTYQYDEYGRYTHVADPRFTNYNDENDLILGETDALHNQETPYVGALGGAITTNYCDAGQSWSLADVLGRHLWSRDARGVAHQVTYDALHRPTEVKQKAHYTFATALKNQTDVDVTGIISETGEAIEAILTTGGDFPDYLLSATPSGDIAQQWEINYHSTMEGIDYYQILTKITNEDGNQGSFRIADKSLEAGYNIKVGDSSSERDHTLWSFTWITEDYYVLVNKNSGLVASKNANSEVITQEAYAGNESQHWKINLGKASQQYEWETTVSKIAYGESVTDAEKYNFRGQAVQSINQGRWQATSGGFNILGLPLSSSMRFTKSHKPTGNYTILHPLVSLDEVDLAADSVLKTATLSDDLLALLQSQAYEQSAAFDAVGELQRSIDAGNNVHLPYFYLSGGVGQMKVNGINFMDEVVLNARKQRLSMKTKNASDNLVTQCHYTYDPKNYSLLQMYASHSEEDASRDDEYSLILNGVDSEHANTRQNLIYTFDPAANVAALPLKMYQGVDAGDGSTLHTFKNSAAYEYDGLYRLIQTQEASWE
ncbi:MAG TPA: hypothetical protein DCS93_18370 [Microscillaceae bacterium]|nr:hypothetical protein [Microscillaceae bacterium]